MMQQAPVILVVIGLLKRIADSIVRLEFSVPIFEGNMLHIGV
jgi:hypothetical protein